MRPNAVTAMWGVLVCSNVWSAAGNVKLGTAFLAMALVIMLVEWIAGIAERRKP